jgi:hypothetical protein
MRNSPLLTKIPVSGRQSPYAVAAVTEESTPLSETEHDFLIVTCFLVRVLR